MGFGFWLIKSISLEPSMALLLIIAFTALPMWLFELYRKESGRRFHLWKIPNRQTVRERTISLIAGAIVWLAVIGFMQLAAPSFINGFFEVIIECYFLMPVLLLHYFFSCEADKSEGGISDLFKKISGNSSRPWPWATIRVHAIKAFFLPMMVTAAYVWVVRTDHTTAQGGAPWWFGLWFAVLYLIDTMFATIGYMTTSKVVDANVRSSDSTWLGWISALSCYAPFSKYIAVLGLTKYSSDYNWFNWLSGSGVWFYVWAILILFFSTVYVWATIVFGLRFSNLTNRGVITTGPFRYSKHPAYISKNISWWMISIPFIPVLGAKTAILSCMSLLFVNFLYFVRAKTEERHLSQDEAYRVYAAWIAEHGLLARAARKIGVPLSRNGQI